MWIELEIQYDHVIAVALGRANTVADLQILCAPRNVKFTSQTSITVVTGYSSPASTVRSWLRPAEAGLIALPESASPM